MCPKYAVNFIFVSLSIKRFHPYFELYFRHGKTVWSSKLITFYMLMIELPMKEA